MGPRLSSWGLSAMDRYSKMKIKAGARRRLGPAQIRDKETTYSSFSKSRRPSLLHMRRKPPWRSKGGGHHPIVGEVNLPIGLLARIHLG